METPHSQASAGPAQASGAEAREQRLLVLLEALKPVARQRFAEQKPASIPRPELALRVGQLVAAEARGEALSLVERRHIVSSLIAWLLDDAETGPGIGDSQPQSPPAAGLSGHAAGAKRSPAEKVEVVTTPAAGRPRLSPEVEKAIARVQPLVMDRLDVTAASQLPRDQLTYQIGEIVSEVLVDERLRVNGAEQQAIVETILDDMLGLGPLEPLLSDATITDIMVNGPRQTYVERNGKLALTDVHFRDNDHLINIARRIVSQVGRRIDESAPLVDARLLDGSRVNIIIPPLAIDGPSISIRKFAKKGITLDVMTQQANVSEQMATVLKIAARSRLNILISGGTGSGKTTLLNAMSQMIDSGERIVTIEDAAELQLQQPHVVRLETRPPNLEGQGEITMRDLVKNSLRMRPDRIILGEVRGSEAVDMLQAMNTGHDGSLGTIHANRPREALTRLENMVGMAGINLPARAVRTQIAAALDLIVQISRMRDGMRRVTHIEEVVGMEGEIITTQTLFTYEFSGEGSDGRLLGQFKSSGLRPHFTPKAAYFGLDRPLLEAMG